MTKRRLPARAWKEGEWNEPISGVTRDFSEDGLFVETRYPFSSNGKVIIELAFSGRTIQLEGVVTQISKDEDQSQSIQVSGMKVAIAF